MRGFVRLTGSEATAELANMKHDRTIVWIRINACAFVRRITAEEPFMKTVLAAGLDLSACPPVNP